MTARRRKRPDPRRRTLLAALLGAVVIAVLGYTALTAGNGLPLKSYYYLNARWGNAAELDPYSDVRIAGVLVGQVLTTSFTGGAATVRLQLEPSVRPLRTDTTARIRLRGLIGAKYVELSPGTQGTAMRSEATIPSSQTSTAVGVFDVLATLDSKRRADLRALLGGLGQGFLGRGAQLGSALGQSPALASDVRVVADAVNARPGAAQRLVPGAESLTAAFDPSRRELVAGWDPQARALAPLTGERRSVRATLSAAPTALDQIRAGLAQTDPLLNEVGPLSRNLIKLTGLAPAALRSATALLRSAAAPLARTRVLAGTLSAAAGPALRLLAAAWPLAAPVTKVLGNQIPPLTQLTRYSCDVAGWARDWSALFALGSPPQTPSGPVGLARAAVSGNSSTTQRNTPGAIHARFYGAPCTATLDKVP
jgi:phospholipid/cholesterol/gamma-HCH transport system substrate-binding protein